MTIRARVDIPQDDPGPVAYVLRHPVADVLKPHTAGDLTLAHSARLVLTYVGLSSEVVITKDHAGEYDLDALYGALLEDLS